MPDIYCKCGEPWDLDSLHEWVAENHEPEEYETPNGRYDQVLYDPLFRAARQEFRLKGCEMFGTSHSNSNAAAGQTFAAIDDIMGDDVDGAIAMMQDAEDMGLY